MNETTVTRSSDTSGQTQSDRKRVQLDLSQKVFDLINDLADRMGAASRAEVVRRALSVYAVLLDEHEAGKRVEVHDPETGQKERLILP
jgi:hypothetical protein